MDYLLKVTVAWTLFLLLFEIFYKSNGKFTANRFYLLFTIAAGLLLPLIPLPSSTPAAVSTMVSTTQAFYPTALSAGPTITAPSIAATTPVAAMSSLNIWLILRIVYGMGIAFLALKLLLESGRMLRLILRRPQQVVNGYKVIVTGKRHAPYSFMGWIFISDLTIYQTAELDYIIRHEAAHSNQKHWLDLLLLQLGCIIFWFHPLIWRYRNLLQLQHEYEADDLAACDETYAYGQFLLQQTLLNGVPAIAHSFHFSPIKNRIMMLTKKQNQKPGAWGYLLIIPALLGCTFLMAKTTDETESLKHNNVTTFNGNTFMWRGTDTSFYDNTRKTAVLTSFDPMFPLTQIRKQKQIVYVMNDEPVYLNEYLKTPAAYGNNGIAYFKYLNKEFATLCKHTPDSLTTVDIVTLVINKEGKIVYSDVSFWYDHTNGKPKDADPAREKMLHSFVDKIINESPNWKPATIDGQPVNSTISASEGC